MKYPTGWILLTFGDKRGYAGHLGYADDPSRVYRYDNMVPNHRQIAEADIALIRDQHKLLGIARIEEVRQEPGKKERHRCPECHIAQISRRSQSADYRCRFGHVFKTPAISLEDCTNYEAHFGESFVAVEGGVTLDELRAACPRYNRQLAMQRVDLSVLAPGLLATGQEVAALLCLHYCLANEGDEQLSTGLDFVPSSSDLNDRVMRAIRRRRGQQQFRDMLRSLYGDACMVSGCRVLELLDAAHISPFRSERDHHAQNGLLLRTDLHTLFDLDLLGINPDNHRVYIHPDVAHEGYDEYHGAGIRFESTARPSSAALRIRWHMFQSRTRLPFRF